MTVAIRPVVQRSVSYSQVVAPRRRRRGSCRCCAAVNFGGRPGAGFAVKAVSPRRRTASRQRITELCEHPSWRATSVTNAPAFSNSIPRRRRRSSSSGLPCGRMSREYRTRHQMSITNAHLNKNGRSFDVLYVSYLEAKHGAPKVFLSNNVFRPVRGLWHLAGYVLSREGAEKLLRLLPCRGPIDLWINHQFEKLDVRATRQPL